jgi:hypothetical protein
MGTVFPLNEFPSSKDLWEFPVEDFLVVAQPHVPGLYILNPSARLVWDLLKSATPIAELVRQFASTYDIPGEVAAQDVTRTLDDWRSGLLSRQQDSSSRVATPPEVAVSSGTDFFAQDYLVLGKNVRVILQTSELADEIAPRLKSIPHAPSVPDFTFRVVEESDGFRIFCNQCCIASEEGVGAARAVLLQEIVRRCRDRDCLAVFHAGACGSSSRCVIFPASTQSGKTTLAAVLMKMGATFYSDDSVLLERDTLTVPVMPFALTVREGSWDVLNPRFPELQEAPIVSRYGQRIRFLPPVGMNREDHAAQVAAIVFSRFKPDGANEISSLDKLHTLLRLQESGFWVAHDEQSIRTFLAWIHSTPSFTLNYSDVDQAASIIRRFIS